MKYIKSLTPDQMAGVTLALCGLIGVLAPWGA